MLKLEYLTVRSNDVIDVAQTVNGVSTFLIVLNEENEPDVYYWEPGTEIHLKEYEYSVSGLLDPHDDADYIEVIGSVDIKGSFIPKH